MNNLSVWAGFSATLRRDLLLAYRRRSDFANPLIFFLIVCSLFPLGIGPSPQRLAEMAPGIVWVVALLACLLASDTLFRSDFDDGSLEQMILSPVSLYLQVLAKTTAHWMLTGLPLALMSPLLALLLQLPSQGVIALMLSLLIGSAVLSLIGAIGAALTVSLRKGGVLLSLIILPLYVPVLIFGVAVVEAAVGGFAYSGLLAVLGAMLALALSLSPLAIAASVKISVDN
ncbi:heme exporter protein CcmB [Dasania sp. GY-MA-18]|uniref:Heme exporter protein B n=1 Tax=Dasania phycosphaerae TaxID=2950436 RepID=A0A9J6RIP4_9GAMM|nr:MULTISPECIES: heme exporter protein CcmB [Dasania]MCR8921692.1 heme exporter protein CcmB [Dasania sp. GY-MA-18]MCZ0864120.1 heme exporter protein CcmB [Dasania phycosphaerae]MCZ0867848.1 heme exporter protein CcmB [Dasania phycosphaerae]